MSLQGKGLAGETGYPRMACKLKTNVEQTAKGIVKVQLLRTPAPERCYETPEIVNLPVSGRSNSVPVAIDFHNATFETYPFSQISERLKKVTYQSWGGFLRDLQRKTEGGQGKLGFKWAVGSRSLRSLSSTDSYSTPSSSHQSSSEGDVARKSQ